MEQQSSHNNYMRRALAKAHQAIGDTSPNPTVGAVIVKNGQVIGEGHTQPPGQPHAEVEAIRAAGPAAQGGTMYVTLEPCNHHGRTPPCTDAIIKAGIAELFYAVADPNPVAHGGHQKLVDAGIKVHQGLLADEAAELNRFFFHHTQTKKPYVIAKFGMSLDGKIATATGHSQWITGPAARQKGHELRQAADAILIGSGTAKADNPRLTTRLPLDKAKLSHPTRIVLDSCAQLPTSLNLFDPEMPGKTILVVTEHSPTVKRAGFENVGTELLIGPADQHGKIDLAWLLSTLGKREIQSVMVEGGSTVLGAFFDAGLVNEVWAFVSPKIIGGHGAPGPIGGLGIDQLGSGPVLANTTFEQIGDDWLIRGKIKSAYSESDLKRSAGVRENQLERSP